MASNPGWGKKGVPRDCNRKLPVNNAVDTKLLVHDDIVNAKIRVVKAERAVR